MKTIFFHYIRQAVRLRFVQLLALVLMLLFVLASIAGTLSYQQRLHSFEQAAQSMRTAWESQGAVNPHNSAHYGHYVFQPATTMQVLDDGILPFAGGLLRLEAHKQHLPSFSAAQQQSGLARFGNLQLAWIVQVVLPLFIVLLGFAAVSADKESGMLRLIAAQGISAYKYLLGKALAVAAMALLLLWSGTFVQWITVVLYGVKNGIDLAHFATWLAAHSLYITAIAFICVAISAALGKSTPSLLLQLALWVLCFLVVPRVAANVAVQKHPLTYRQTFNFQLSEDRKNGIDGHNPSDERIRHFQDSLLQYYGVSTRDSLPVNADGLVMQADEDYSNLVYDKHYQQIKKVLDQQNRWIQLSGLLSPYPIVKSLSMAYSQSDYKHHLQFIEDAESYRRVLIKTLNDEMAYGGSRTGDWDWAPDSSWYARIPDFEYKQPGISALHQWQALQWAGLLFWLAAAVIFLLSRGNRLFQL